MRIHICGIYGSGKSTLARELTKELGIKNYSLDDLKYKVKYSKIRSVEERTKLLKKICSRKDWIIEGAWSDYAEEAFKKANFVILMNLPKSVCSYRIIKRHLLRKKEGEKYEQDSFFGALRLVRKVYRYHFSREPVSFYAHKKLIDKHHKKCLIVRTSSDIPKVVRMIKEGRVR